MTTPNYKKYFSIHGPQTLHGTVRASGSKNASLPLLFASILSHHPVSFLGLPQVVDIEVTLKLLASLGYRHTKTPLYPDQKKTQKNTPKNIEALPSYPSSSIITTIIPPPPSTIIKPIASYEFVSAMRAGILALGPLVSRYKEACVSLPGGCQIGARPVNYHIDGLKALGATVDIKEGGYIKAHVPQTLRGCTYQFPTVSVTGTENMMMAACLAEGTTTLIHAAQEPEIFELAYFLKKVLGISIEGIGTSTLIIHGRPNNPSSIQQPISTDEPWPIPTDRIEEGTWIMAALATHPSHIIIKDIFYPHLFPLLVVAENMGAHMKFLHKDAPLSKTNLHELLQTTRVDLEIKSPNILNPVDIRTAPFPGFPTDMQAQTMVALTQAHGKSLIHEDIFENRLMHVAELKRLGAKISFINTNSVEIIGSHRGTIENNTLHGAIVRATDLRASASLMIGALIAKGTTIIKDIYHLERGYEDLSSKLKALGGSLSTQYEEP